MVNLALIMVGDEPERLTRYTPAMSDIFISGRPAVADAAELIGRFGELAESEAALRAEHSRDLGNVVRFCHWRQIERLIVALRSREVGGTVH